MHGARLQSWYDACRRKKRSVVEDKESEEDDSDNDELPGRESRSAEGSNNADLQSSPQKDPPADEQVCRLAEEARLVGF